MSKFKVCKIVGVGSFQQKPVQVQQGAGLWFGSHLAQLSIFHVEVRFFALLLSARCQHAAWLSRMQGQTSMNLQTILHTSDASLDRFTLVGGILQSYVRS